MCHTRELAYQIRDEYNRFSKYMPDIKTGVFYGGTPIKTDIETLKNKDTCPHIIVGTPGRLKALVRDKALRLGSVRIFVLDECDKMLDQPGESRSCNQILTYANGFRYAHGCARCFPRYTSPEAGYDVLGHLVRGGETYLPKVHAEPDRALRR